MSHYRLYGEPEPVVAGFTVEPEDKIVIVHPEGQLPFKYEDLTTMNLKKWNLSGHTFVWYDPESKGVGWTLEIPPVVRDGEWSSIKFRGTAYVTGHVSFSPHPRLQNCGTPLTAMHRRVSFDADDAS